MKHFLKFCILLLAWPCFAQQSSPPALPSNLYTTPGGIPSSPSGSSGGASSATGVYLSPNCSVGSVTLPCINIPAGGGCYGASNGTSTVSVSNGSPTVTFSGGFPNPVPVVGQMAWVGLEKGGVGTSLPSNLCSTIYTLSQLVTDSWQETTYCGKRFSAGGTPITITAVDPIGGTVTLSQNCLANGSTSAVFFYMPNIYSQMQTACLGPNGNGFPPQIIHLAAGLYGLDNAGAPQSACGCQQIGGNCTVNYSFGKLSGEGRYITELYTPPWYDHEGDLGTVLAGGTLENITLDGGWATLTNSNGKGTIYHGSSCDSHDFSIVGFNLGNGNISETIYPGQGIAPVFGSGSPCSITNALIEDGNRGVVTGYANFVNDVIITGAVTLFEDSNGTTNHSTFLDGGYYASGGMVSNSSTTLGAVINHETSLTPNADIYVISNADLCQAGAANNAIIDSEASGEVRIINSRINSGVFCTPGTNAAGISITSGVNLRMSQTAVKANGTGNTLTIPSGATLFDNCGNTTTGGAGFSFGGTYIPAGGCALNDAAPTISSGFGTSPSIAAGSSVSSFQINVGTGGTATSGVIGLPTSPKTGWNCTVQDGTTNIATRQTANTASSATFTAASAWTASDILIVSCRPY